MPFLSLPQFKALLMLFIGSLILLSVITRAAVIPSQHEIHERRSASPQGWKRGSRLEKHVALPVRIALTQSNMEALHDYLMQVSEPSSSQYGKHWTVDKVRDMFAPSQDTREKVTNWLVDSGISSQRLKHNTGSGGWISFEATVEEAEELFQTQYYHWSHPKSSSGKSFPAVAESYSLPAHIRPHVDFVTPTLHFDMKLGRAGEEEEEEFARLAKRKEYLQRRDSKQKLGSPNSPTLPQFVPVSNPKAVYTQLTQCDEFITPVCLRALYNLPTLSTLFSSNKKNSIAVVEYTPQQYNASDLALFFSNYSTNQKQKIPTLVSIDGGDITEPVSGFGYNGESNLDLEYMMTLVNPIPVTLYQTGDANVGASFNNFLDAFDASYCAGDDSVQDSKYPDPYGYTGNETCGGVTMAKVISTSYVYNEADLSPAYETRQCLEYAKLGLLGTTFLYGSGDNGVAGLGDQCLDPVTGQHNDGTSGRFSPSFPGTCPYVLAVGATQINSGASVLQPESACEQVIYSGGGFSNTFALPSYQRSAVSTYFNKYAPSYTSAQYNNSRATRGFPDVSANGANYLVSVNGQYLSVFGTSASSPVFASVLGLINEARLNLGKSTVGFVNPALYANPSMFNDITSGSNPGCGTDGFTAVPGWDPVTGLGTPNYLKMLTYFSLF